MIYILNNIKFGHPKLSKHQIEYFYKYLIPLMKRRQSTREDKIIITGDLFHNTKNITFNLISIIQDIFDCLSSLHTVEIVGNDYCVNIIKDYVTQINTIEQDVKISLFHLSINDDNEVGFYLMKEDKTKIIKNDFSPKFIEYTINNIEDIDTFEISKNFINLNINSQLLNSQQNKNKIDIFLNNNQFNNIYYMGEVDDEDRVKLDSKNINIRDILINNIEDDLKGELDEIFTIYDESNP